MGFCDINHDAEKNSKRKKKPLKNLKKKKMIDFLEVKKENRKIKYYDKKQNKNKNKPLLLLNSFCDPDLCLTTSILS